MLTAAPPIPLVDLRLQHAQISQEVSAGWQSVTERGAFVLGEEVAAFEQAFAAFSGVRHCIGVGSGTDALELALRAVGVGPGDEVILPTNSFVATAEAVVRAGGRPVLVDVDPRSYLIDSRQVAAAISPRTRAIVPVHLYGQIAPIEDLGTLARERGIVIVEDAAQAHGAVRHGATAGSLGLAAATSFYPGKNLGAYGDGGAVLTRSDVVAGHVRALRNHGSEHKYQHPQMGFNSRLDTLQAVVLHAKLRHLSAWNTARRQAARRYDELLEDLPQILRPLVLPGNEHVWHLYVVRVPSRDRVLSRLHADGIQAGVHYPVPIHLQGALRDLGHLPGDFPHAETAASQVLSLPLFPGITRTQQERVVEALRRAIG